MIPTLYILVLLTVVAFAVAALRTVDAQLSVYKYLLFAILVAVVFQVQFSTGFTSDALIPDQYRVETQGRTFILPLDNGQIVIFPNSAIDVLKNEGNGSSVRLLFGSISPEPRRQDSYGDATDEPDGEKKQPSIEVYVDDWKIVVKGPRVILHSTPRVLVMTTYGAPTGIASTICGSIEFAANTTNVIAKHPRGLGCTPLSIQGTIIDPTALPVDDQRIEELFPDLADLESKSEERLIGGTGGAEVTEITEDVAVGDSTRDTGGTETSGPAETSTEQEPLGSTDMATGGSTSETIENVDDSERKSTKPPKKKRKYAIREPI